MTEKLKAPPNFDVDKEQFPPREKHTRRYKDGNIEFLTSAIGPRMGDRVIYSQEELLFNFRLIMLLDKEYEPDEDVRINKAFRHMGEDPADEARFDSYVRGGVDVLYEKLIEGVSSPDEYVMRLYDFVEEFQEKFNEEMSSEDILKLCSK